MDDHLPALDLAGLRFVRIVWTDHAGIIRSKAIHVGAMNPCMRHGVGISPAAMAVPATMDRVVPEAGTGPVGEIRLLPEWNTLIRLPYAHGHARVMADMALDGKPWEICPRQYLREVVARFAQIGLNAQVAFENEFYLLKPTQDGLQPLDDTLFAASTGIDHARAIIDDIADALLEQMISVQMYHPESGPGQQELSIRHASPVQAADHQIMFRETVHAIAGRFGLKASFLPKLFADAAGSGSHLNLSLWQDNLNVMADARGMAGLSPLGHAFLAGILEHLPALMAITTPSPNSYRRLQPHCWSGAYQCWGIDNREAAIRVPTDLAGHGTQRIELKTCDATSNPYLAIGAVLTAGLDGIERKCKLPAPVLEDPGNWTNERLLNQGIARLPANLGESLEQLQRSRLLQESLGPKRFQAFLAVRKAEWSALGQCSLEEESKLLLQRY